MGRLTGKTAIITGASSGVGEATALALALEGAAVVLAARRLDRLKALVNDIHANGGRALAVQVDIADTGQVQRMVMEAI